MRLQKKLVVAIVVALAVLFIAMFASVIPCQTAANVPNPQYSWTFCDFNPDEKPVTALTLYLGFTESLRGAYVLALMGVFVLIYVVLHFTMREKH